MGAGIYSSRSKKRCIIYIRVSSERQVEGFSIDGQRRYLTQWAEAEGMTVTGVYVEPGRSGKSISGREVFQQMLDDVATGAVKTDFVLVFKLSRFGRNAKDVLNSLAFLMRYNVHLLSKEDGLDSSTATLSNQLASRSSDTAPVLNHSTCIPVLHGAGACGASAQDFFFSAPGRSTPPNSLLHLRRHCRSLSSQYQPDV